jgi:hypothetical protein
VTTARAGTQGLPAWGQHRAETARQAATLTRILPWHAKTGGRCASLEQALNEPVTTWRLHPVVEALQALRGVPCTVAVPTVTELGNLTRFDNPRQLMDSLGLTPSEPSRGPRRRQGAMTKAGNSHARRALGEGAWAYRYPAKVSRHLQLRLEKQPKVIQDISWKAQVRLCKRYRPKPSTETMSRTLPGTPSYAMSCDEVSYSDIMNVFFVTDRIKSFAQFIAVCRRSKMVSMSTRRP